MKSKEERLEFTMNVLRRSEDQIVGGVCSGIAEFLGWPKTKVRVLYVALSCLSAAFPGIFVYLILWIVMPPPDCEP